MPGTSAIAEPRIVAVITPQGDRIGLPEGEQLDFALSSGYRLESPAESLERAGREQERANYSGLANEIRAGMAGLARGATLGGFDVVARGLGGKETADYLAGLQRAHPTISTVTGIAGAVAPAVLTAGASAGESAAAVSRALAATPAAETAGAAYRALAAATPVGYVTRAGRAISGAGAANIGIVGKAGLATVGAGVEGALYNAGSYASDVALGNRDLSAQAFVGAMGQGALYGAPFGAGGVIVERTAARVRKLFPRSEMTQETINTTQQDLRRGIEEATASADEMLRKAEMLKADARIYAAQNDPLVQAKIAAIRSKTQVAEARASLAMETQRQRAEIALERARRGPVRQPRNLKSVPEVPTAPTSTEAAPSIEMPSPAGSDLAEHQAAIEGVAKPAALAPVTWKQFVKEGMGPAMKEAGSHGGAMKILGDRWRALKEAAPSAGAPPPLAGSDLAARAAALEGLAGAEAKRTEAAISEAMPAPSVARSIDDQIDDVVSQGDPAFSEIRDAAQNLAAEKQRVQDWIAKYRRQDGTTTAYEFGGFPGKRLQAGEAHPSNVYARKVGYEPTPKGWEPPVEGVATMERKVVGDELISYDPATGEIYKRRTVLPQTAEDIAAGEVRYAELPANRTERLKAAAEKRGEVYVEKARKTTAKPEEPQDVFVMPTAERQAAMETQRAAFLARPGMQTLEAPWLKRPIGEVRQKVFETELAEAVDVLGGFEKAQAELATALGPHAPPAAVAQAEAYRAAVAQQGAGASEHAAIAIDDAVKRLHEVPGAPEVAPPPPPVAVQPPAAAPSVGSPHLDEAMPGAGTASPPAPAAATAVPSPGASPGPSAGAPAGAPQGTVTRAGVGQTAPAPVLGTAAKARTPEAATGAKRTGIRGAAENTLAAMELLQEMGVPGVPDIDNVPVIGPILSKFVLLRAMMKVGGRWGGKIPKTVETSVAEHAAALRNRVATSVDRLLEGTTKAARKVAPATIPTVVTLMAHQVPREPGKRPPVDNQEYIARLDDLGRAASNPDAVRAAVRASVPIGNPDMARAIANAAVRKVQFIHDKAPRVPFLPSILNPRRTWTPDRVALAKFARYLHAADDPASVLEDLEHGIVTPEGAETLKTVYPDLFAEAQMRLVERAGELATKLPYNRLVQISSLFEVAVDPSMQPDYVAMLQDGYQDAAQQPTQPPQPGGAPPGQPPTPSIAADMNLGAAYQTGADRRAQR